MSLARSRKFRECGYRLTPVVFVFSLRGSIRLRGYDVVNKGAAPVEIAWVFRKALVIVLRIAMAIKLQKVSAWNVGTRRK